MCGPDFFYTVYNVTMMVVVHVRFWPFLPVAGLTKPTSSSNHNDFAVALSVKVRTLHRRVGQRARCNILSAQKYQFIGRCSMWVIDHASVYIWSFNIRGLLWTEVGHSIKLPRRLMAIYLWLNSSMKAVPCYPTVNFLNLIARVDISITCV